MSYGKYYVYSLIGIILASFYPIYMGVVSLGSYLQNGYIDLTDYQKYIIPYTPMCIALITSTALMPLVFKIFQSFTLPIVSLFGITIFLAAELWFEDIQVKVVTHQIPVDSWQLSLCMATPEVLRSIGEPIFAAKNPAFKIHFYIIAIVIIIAVLNVIYGFSKMFRQQDFGRKRPLIAQTVSVLLFIGLCILACFTAFYRNGTINISPLSAVLMSVFFIVFGITAGIYIGSILYGKSKLLSVLIPAIAASLTTLIMYVGELVLMGGVLFKYGKGLLFKPIGAIPFAAVDIGIILISGAVTYVVMKLLNREPSCI